MTIIPTVPIYFTGFKYLSSLESYRMADVEGLRGAIEDGFPI